MASHETSRPTEEKQNSERINGVIDLPRPNRVTGWAIDRADPLACVLVDVFREHRKIAEIAADTYRLDLERAGIGTGRYGFSLDLDPPVAPGLGFTITAQARAGDGAVGSLRQIGETAPSDDPGRRLSEETLCAVFSLVTEMQAGREACSPEADAMALADAIERVEVLQARIEEGMAASAPNVDRSLPIWLLLGVAMALILGVLSLSLGISSFFVG